MVFGPPPPPNSYRQLNAITHCCSLESERYRWCHIVWRLPHRNSDENSLLLVLSSSVLLVSVYSVKEKETMGLFHFNLEASLALCCCR